MTSNLDLSLQILTTFLNKLVYMLINKKIIDIQTVFGYIKRFLFLKKHLSIYVNSKGIIFIIISQHQIFCRIYE